MVQKVLIQAVDTDRIEKDDSFPKAYAFYIVLTSAPDPIWVELFVSQYENRFYNLKREMTTHGDRIRVVTAPGEEENHVRFFRELVNETNKQVDEYNKKLTDTEARERRFREQQDAEAQQIRERLKKISIG